MTFNAFISSLTYQRVVNARLLRASCNTRLAGNGVVIAFRSAQYILHQYNILHVIYVLTSICDIVVVGSW